jgi:polyferredoxin
LQTNLFAEWHTVTQLKFGRFQKHRIKNCGDLMLRRCHSNQKMHERALGVRYMVFSPILLVLLYALLQCWMAASARLSDAPNQGAMLLAFLILVAGGVAAIILSIKGLVLVVRSYIMKEDRSDP